MEFKERVLRRYGPALAVLSTPAALELCVNATGVSVAELLRPLGSLHGLSVPVRTVGEQAYRLKELHFRFFPTGTLRMPPAEVAESHLKAVLTEAARASDVAADLDLLAELRAGRLPGRTAGFETFEAEFLRLLSFTELETFDHPVAGIAAVASTEAAPVAAIGALETAARRQPLPEPGSGAEAGLPQLCLVLHDARTGTQESLRRCLEDVLRRFGEALCFVLHLDTGPEEAGDPALDGLLAAHRQRAVPGGAAGEPAVLTERPTSGFGAGVGQKDWQALSRFIEEMALRVILPHLENRVRRLYGQVMATRRGMRNQLKNLLWRSKSSAAEMGKAAPGGAAGQPVEAQMRVLADLAFLMQDYETCLATLRLLSSDLKAERDWAHYAAAQASLLLRLPGIKVKLIHALGLPQEMLGLATFMSGGPAGEVSGPLREAFGRYDAARNDRELRRFATRSQLLLAECCSQNGQFAEANAALMRAQGQEENLHAAILLEQAALYLLHLGNPGIRKWAFHLVLAALRFSNCQQPHLANRAYRQVLQVFGERRWPQIDGHLQEMLGKHAAETGDALAAVRHLAAALACRHAQAGRQRDLLARVLDIARTLSPAEADELALELSLPTVGVHRLNVVADDAVTYANAEARMEPETAWRAVGNALLASAGQEPLGKAPQQEAAGPTGVAGEELGIDVDLHNPLSVQLRLSKMQVCAEASSSANCEAEPEAITLRGGEKVRVRLKFRALQPGSVTIQGVSWLVEGVARGYKALQPSGGRRAWPSQGAQPPGGILFCIVPAMPRLQIEFDGLDARICEGELVRLRATVRNVGSLRLGGLRLAIQQSDLLCCPSADHEGGSWASLADCTAVDGSGRPSLAGHRPLTASGAWLSEWPAGNVIAPGSTLEWPFVFHPRSAGPICLRAVWLYVAAPRSERMPWRMLRWSANVEVAPLLRIAAEVVPSTSEPQRCLLHLRIHKAETSSRVRVCDVACSSPGWGLTWLGGRSDNVETGRGDSSDMELDGADSSLLLRLTARPETSRAERGCEWLANGPAAHFHAQRRRALQQHSPVPPDGQLDGDVGAATSDVSGSPARLASASALQHTGAQPATDFAVAWAIAGSRARIGMTHLVGCKLREEVLMQVVPSEERELEWDFAAGPMLADVLLKACNRREVPASVCWEVGTSLALQPQATDAAEARCWHFKPPAKASTDGESPATPAAASASGRAGPVGAAHYIWAGRTRATISRLAPGQQADIPLQVLVCKPGMLCLTDYSLFWTFADGVMNVAQLGPPILLSVRQAS